MCMKDCCCWWWWWWIIHEIRMKYWMHYIQSTTYCLDIACLMWNNVDFTGINKKRNKNCERPTVGWRLIDAITQFSMRKTLITHTQIELASLTHILFKTIHRPNELNTLFHGIHIKQDVYVYFLHKPDEERTETKKFNQIN